MRPRLTEMEELKYGKAVNYYAHKQTGEQRIMPMVGEGVGTR